MKIYTKSGDKGETSLVHGVRISKASSRVEAYGTCDEANSQIGVARSFLQQEIKSQHGEEYPASWQAFFDVLHVIQTKLFHIGNELSTPKGKQPGWPIQEEDLDFMEQEIDRMDEQLSPLTNFILPGGHPAGANLHLARTTVRRAERCVVAIPEEEEINPVALKYLNRLSDYLFVAGRYVNNQLGYVEPNLHQD